MPSKSHQKLSHLLLVLAGGIFASCSDSKTSAEKPEKLPDSEHLELAESIPVINQKISFNEHVRPIFNKNCTTCHGGVNVGTDGKLPGKLSLIYDISGVRGKSKNLAVIAGNPEESELYKRITAEDGDVDLMPQAEHGPRLKDDEVNIIRQWIEQGAEWDVHWAYKAPVSKQAPETKMNWSNKKIDSFILSKMEQRELQPTKVANSPTLLRRLSFDLTGLPPTINELDEFEAAHKADPDIAYAAAVDRLLASDAYGERWASVWMDLSRYADSEGMGLDRRRNVWPFRDWLIKSFNDDMPFDQFTIKLLAGDLLENPTHADLIATTFHRLTQANEEGGTDDEEFRVAAVMDRVNTTWEVWQGQTFGCVQCHSHPYDTIEHDEYYKFLAFFNNDQDIDVSSHIPTIKVPDTIDKYPEANAKLNALNKAEIDYISPAQDIANKSKWLTTSGATVTSENSKTQIKNTGTHEEIHTVGNKKVVSSFTLNWKPTTQKLEAIKITILPKDEKAALSNPEHGAGLSTVKLSIELLDGTKRDVPIEHLIPDSQENTFYFRDSLKGNAYGWGPYTKMFHPRWAVIVPTEEVSLSNVKTVTLKMDYKLQILAFIPVPDRSRVEYTDDPRWATWKTGAKAKLKVYEEARKVYNDIPGIKLPIMKSRDPKLARNTHVFERGNWLEKGALITKPGTPKSFPPLMAEQPENPTRLDMARWLASERNPLTARIAVNRYWQQLFGIGLVETLEDFGSSGMAPTHQDLLDDLAVRFITEHQWKPKSLLKEIVMSATYQQSAAVSREHRAKDPTNVWLSYSPRRRLRAEAIRDMGLANSGLVTHQLFGKPTFPPIPPGVWKPFVSDRWKTPEVGDPQRYRRALYTYWKRSIPYPALMAFDSPTREMCSKRRLISNTPTAALTTLNDEAYAEFAKGLARRMKNELETATIREKLTFGYRVTTSQRPDEATLNELEATYQTAEKYYQNHPGQLKGMAATADGGAYTIVASLLLNLDASLTK
tara:strand:- start:36167 stop:39166 length:3000 start_codon:yes stop_codon:yes gene_type:complete